MVCFREKADHFYIVRFFLGKEMRLGYRLREIKNNGGNENEEYCEETLS